MGQGISRTYTIHSTRLTAAEGIILKYDAVWSRLEPDTSQRQQADTYYRQFLIFYFKKE